MHSDNRPPTLHGGGQDTHGHRHTETLVSPPQALRRGPGCGAGTCHGGRFLSLVGYFCSLPGKASGPPSNEAPTISRRSQADKWEPGQQPVPNPMVKRASQPPPQGRSSSDHQGEAGVPVSSGTALRAAMGSNGTVSSF